MLTPPRLKEAYWALSEARSFGDALEVMLDQFLLATGLQLKDDWCRVVMDRETKRLVDAISPQELSALEISGSAWSSRCSFKQYQSTSYPDYDVCAQPLDARFDLVIAEQVWEHIESPLEASKNVYSMLREGGWFLVSTPFLLRLHARPHDFYRWTESGLRQLLISAGFEASGIVSGSWGNRACVRANFDRWMPYRPLFHSLENEPEFPVVVWALARKRVNP